MQDFASLLLIQEEEGVRLSVINYWIKFKDTTSCLSDIASSWENLLFVWIFTMNKSMIEKIPVWCIFLYLFKHSFSKADLAKKIAENPPPATPRSLSRRVADSPT